MNMPPNTGQVEALLECLTEDAEFLRDAHVVVAENLDDAVELIEWLWPQRRPPDPEPGHEPEWVKEARRLHGEAVSAAEDGNYCVRYQEFYAHLLTYRKPRVRQLDWRQVDDLGWRAERYHVYERDGKYMGWSLEFELPIADGEPSADAAKAVCQKHHAEQVLGFLEAA